jgi:hypothetical protein
MGPFKTRLVENHVYSFKLPARYYLDVHPNRYPLNNPECIVGKYRGKWLWFTRSRDAASLLSMDIQKKLTLCSQSYESHGPYINDLPNQPKSPHSLQIFACVVMKVRQSVPGQLLVSSYWDPKTLEKKCRFYFWANVGPVSQKYLDSIGFSSVKIAVSARLSGSKNRGSKWTHKMADVCDRMNLWHICQLMVESYPQAIDHEIRW